MRNQIYKIRNILILAFIIFDVFHAMLFYSFKIIPNYVYQGFFSLAGIITLIFAICLDSKLRKNKMLWLAIGMLILLAFSTFQNREMVNDPVRLYRFATAHITCLTLLLFWPENKSEREYEIFMKILFWVYTLASTASLVGYLMTRAGFDFSRYTALEMITENRLTALYQNPNLAGINSLLGMLIAIRCYQKSSGWKKNALIAVILMQILVNVLSNCRASLFMLGIYCIVMFCQYLHEKKKIKIHYWLIILVLAVAFLLMMAVSLEVRYKTFSIGLEETQGQYMHSVTDVLNRLSSSRLTVQKDALILGMKSPIYGNGLCTFAKTAEKWLPDSIVWKSHYESSHNLYVDAFYCGGIIGLVLTILMTVEWFRLLKARKKRTDHNEYLVEVFIVTSIFEYACLNPAILFTSSFPTTVFWSIIGFLMADNCKKGMLTHA